MLIYPDVFTHRKKEKRGERGHALLCVWHRSLTNVSSQRLHQSRGVLEVAVSNYSQLERDPQPYGIQVRSLAVLRNGN